MSIKGRTAIFPHNIDRSTDASARVDYEHHEVHDGSCFYYSYTAPVDNTINLDRFIITPDTPIWAHLLWEIESQALCTISIYEDAIGASNLTTSYNRNRNYAGSNTTVVHIPTESPAEPAGTLIWRWTTGTTGPRVGHSPYLLRTTGELVLQQNTKYLLRVTSGRDDNVISEYLTWYEHRNIE